MDLMASVGMCVVSFAVDVPVTDFYEIGVGRRGELSYTLAELTDADFNVELSIGS